MKYSSIFNRPRKNLGLVKFGCLLCCSYFVFKICSTSVIVHIYINIYLWLWPGWVGDEHVACSWIVDYLMLVTVFSSREFSVM